MAGNNRAVILVVGAGAGLFLLSRAKKASAAKRDPRLTQRSDPFTTRPTTTGIASRGLFPSPSPLGFPPGSTAGRIAGAATAPLGAGGSLLDRLFRAIGGSRTPQSTARPTSSSSQQPRSSGSNGPSLGGAPGGGSTTARVPRDRNGEPLPMDDPTGAGGGDTIYGRPGYFGDDGTWTEYLDARTTAGVGDDYGPAIGGAYGELPDVQPGNSDLLGEVYSDGIYTGDQHDAAESFDEFAGPIEPLDATPLPFYGFDDFVGPVDQSPFEGPIAPSDPGDFGAYDGSYYADDYGGGGGGGGIDDWGFYADE